MSMQTTEVKHCAAALTLATLRSNLPAASLLGQWVLVLQAKRKKHSKSFPADMNTFSLQRRATCHRCSEGQQQLR